MVVRATRALAVTTLLSGKSFLEFPTSVYLIFASSNANILARFRPFGAHSPPHGAIFHDFPEHTNQPFFDLSSPHLSLASSISNSTMVVVKLDYYTDILTRGALRAPARRAPPGALLNGRRGVCPRRFARSWTASPPVISPARPVISSSPAAARTQATIRARQQVFPPPQSIEQERCGWVSLRCETLDSLMTPPAAWKAIEACNVHDNRRPRALDPHFRPARPRSASLAGPGLLAPPVAGGWLSMTAPRPDCSSWHRVYYESQS